MAPRARPAKGQLRLFDPEPDDRDEPGPPATLATAAAVCDGGHQDTQSSVPPDRHVERGDDEGRKRSAANQRAWFDPDADERDEPAAGLDRTPSDEHPEREFDDRNPAWREWTLCRVALPAIVSVTSVETRKPRGRCKADAMLAVLVALAQAAGDRRGVALSIPALAELARLSPSHTERTVVALESLFLVEVHRRERRPGRQREPHTYAIAWGNVRDLVPPVKALGEPPLVASVAGADVPSHEGTPNDHVPSHEGTPPLVTSPRGAPPTSSENACNAHAHERGELSEGLEWLGHVDPENVRDPEWVEAVYRRAVAARFVTDDRANRLFVHAAAVRSRAAKKSAGGLLRKILRTRNVEDRYFEHARAIVDTLDGRTSIDQDLVAGIGKSVPSAHTGGRPQAERERAGHEASLRALIEEWGPRLEALTPAERAELASRANVDDDGSEGVLVSLLHRLRFESREHAHAG